MADEAAQYTRTDAKALNKGAGQLLKRARKHVSDAIVEEVEAGRATLVAAIATGDFQAEAAALDALVDKKLGFARKSAFREYAEAIGFALLIALSLRAAIFEPYRIPSSSMEETLLVGDRVVASKLAYGFRIPFTSRFLFRWGEGHRGDIVVFQFPRRQAITRTRMGRLMQSLDRIQARTGEVPDALSPSTVRQSSGSPFGDEEFRDAWGGGFRYELLATDAATEAAAADGAAWRISSAGPDRDWGTADDITSDQVRTSFSRGAPCRIDDGSLRRRKNYIKRIVGLPGETIELRQGRLYIDGIATERLAEHPEAFPLPNGMVTQGIRAEERFDNGREYEIQYAINPRTDFGPYRVPEGHYFMMGDNRDFSADSRCWGPVPIDNFKARARFVVLSSGSGFLNIRTDRIMHRVR